MVVIGDKSASMDVAIRTSNIIASLVARISDAELVFFDSVNVPAPYIPTTVELVRKIYYWPGYRGWKIGHFEVF